MNENFRVYIRQHPRFGRYYQAVETKPSWVIKAALIAAAIVVVVPVVMLTLAAVVVGLIVFALLGVVAGMMRLVGGLFDRPSKTPAPPPDPGRENVRVIRD